MNRAMHENRLFESSETISNLIEYYQNLQSQNVVNKLNNEKSKLERNLQNSMNGMIF